MAKYLIVLLSIVFSNLLAGLNPDQKYSLAKAESYVQTKNYYLLTLFQQLPEVNKLITADAELSKIAISKRNSLSVSLKNCGENVNCYLENIRFSDIEIQNVGNRGWETYF